MNAEKQFWDSNLWVYLFVPSDNLADVEKQSKLLARLESEPDITVSVQVQNEVANTLMKKYKFDETRTEEILDSIDHSTAVIPLTKTLSFEALFLKKTYNLSWFDSPYCGRRLVQRMPPFIFRRHAAWLGHRRKIDHPKSFPKLK